MPGVRTIAVINQKGGVGKTTTVANLGAAIADSGRGVCLLDLDPQAHLSLHFGVEPTDDKPGMYEVISGDAKLRETLQHVRSSLWLAASSIDLAGAEVEMVNTVGREQVLRDAFGEAALSYDFTFIDCPPSLGLLTLNALAAADEVIIPLQPHFLALQGLGKLLETVSLVQRRINPSLRVSGVILCMYETTTRLAGEVRDDLREFLASARGGDAPWSAAYVFETFIRRNVKLAECPSYGSTIFDYDRSSHGARDYAALAEEFLAMRAALPVCKEHIPQQYVPHWASTNAMTEAPPPTSTEQHPEPRE
ncbi:MAG: ParA family protein [Phycisphaerae bacterium]